MIDLRLGDCLTFEDAGLYHAMLCDPPYELGFMGRDWDKSGIAFRPEVWAKLAEHLYDGAFGMAFASSRGWHRLACAIEDAGLIIHPTIFGWAYGSGFPKATRINHGDPHTETFNGHRYGLQALKPALEPIIVFQKPYRGKTVDCITRTGAGALWIDGARIEASSDYGRSNARADGTVNKGEFFSGLASGTGLNGYANSSGRWPANFVLLDAAAAQALDAQSGERGNGHWSSRRSDGGTIYGGGRGLPPNTGYNDERDGLGGASRFFYRVAEQIDDADPVCYAAKASRRERDAGLDGMPTSDNGTISVHDNGINSERALRARGRSGKIQPRHNPHPTVKPIALTRWLATLLLPPAEYAPRRLFVPFAGVGSEMIGAMLAGWDDVTGVESNAEYVEIGNARVRHWQGIEVMQAQMVMPLEMVKR